MNWLAEYLKKSCDLPGDCAECRMLCPSALDLFDETGVSPAVIGVLRRGGVTHPNFADRIADFIGATPAQRDMLVAEKHRGNYVPGRALKRKRRREKLPGARPCNAERQREVVALSMGGKVLARYPNLQEAGRKNGISANTAQVRCARTMQGKFSEFHRIGCTFRFADEWENMSLEEQLEDMMAAMHEKAGTQTGGAEKQ